MSTRSSTKKSRTSKKLSSNGKPMKLDRKKKSVTPKAGKSKSKSTKKKPPRRRPDIKWTTNNLVKFLEIVQMNGGNVTAAVNELGLSRSGFYRRKEESKRFANLVDEAIDRGIDTLEDEARRRAFEGVSTPIVSGGKIVTHVQKYSDFLMGLMLKAHRKKYKERHEITGADGQPFNQPIIHAYIPDNGRKRDTAVIAERINNGNNGCKGRNKIKAQKNRF